MSKNLAQSRDVKRRSLNNNVDTSTFLFGRVPPQARDLEESIIGAMMLEKEIIYTIGAILPLEAFYVEAHQLIYVAIKKLYSRSQPVDILTVTEQLRKDNQLENVGGAHYVTGLTDKVISSTSAEYYARIILEKFIQRELIRISFSIARDAFDDTVDVFDLVNMLIKCGVDITEVIFRGRNKNVSHQVSDFMRQLEAASKNRGHLLGLASGLSELDSYTRGYIAPNLIVVAARPGMGKTTFIIQNIAFQIVVLKKKVTFFSLEMNASEIILKLTANLSGIDSDSIKSAELSDLEWKRVIKASDLIAESLLVIEDNGGMTYQEIVATSKKHFIKNGCDIIYVDYLQLVGISSEDKYHNRVVQIGNISRSLKALAKELNVPVVALSQLNRSVEKNSNKIPMLSDLRESGDIEQDADIVIFIYRPEYYFPDGHDESGNSFRGLARLICAKHRNGSLFDVKVSFIAKYSRFVDISFNERYFSDDML